MTWGKTADTDADDVATSLKVDGIQQLTDDQLAALLAQAPGVPAPAVAAAPVKEPAPENAAGAIAAGLRLFAAGDTAAALALFEASLELPGSGVLRVKGKPRELSQGETQAALYNAACCHARLRNTSAGLEALRACVAAGFDDWAALRTDKDLAALRASPEWSRFAASFEQSAGAGGGGGLLSRLFGR